MQRTTTSTIPGLVLGLLLVLPLPTAPPAAAETSPEAQQWLDKLLGVFEQGSFTVEYSMAIDLAGIGQPVEGTLDGAITFGDRHHTRTEMKMELSGMGLGEQGPVAMKMTSVNDGEVTWTEVDSPAMGGKQVMKLSQEDATKLSGQPKGAGLGASPGSMDPVAQLDVMARRLDFEILETADGTVSLRGKIRDEQRAELGQLAMLGVDSFLLVLDRETGFPREIRAGGDQPLLRMRFQNLQFSDSLPEDVFEYDPPAGAQIIDLGAMVRTETY